MGSWEEFTAKTVNDAVTEASVSLQVPSFMLEYEVLEESKGGILGLFSKPAKIRARVKSEEDIKAEEKKKQDEEKRIFKEKEELKKEEARKAEQKKQSEVKQEVKPAPVKKMAETKSVNAVDVENVAKKFLNEVLKAMKIEAVVVVAYEEEEGAVSIDIQGEDMGILIGKRGQTLDSLQYLTSLVLNKETSSYMKVKLDTENYRERRRVTLENLAKNIAYKVKRTKHSVSLEPMNPYERRIIHSTLQSDKFVETHSEGEEPYRKVVVTLKKGYRDYNTSNNNRNNRGRYNNNRKDYKKNFSEKENSEVKTEE